MKKKKKSSREPWEIRENPSGNWIAIRRGDRNLTQREAAEDAGVTQSLWQVWETSPTIDNRSYLTLRCIACVLRCTIAELGGPA